MVQDALPVIKTEQERTHHVAALVISKAPDHAVGTAQVLDLLHRIALSGAVREVATFGDDAIERTAEVLDQLLAAER